MSDALSPLNLQSHYHRKLSTLRSMRPTIALRRDKGKGDTSVGLVTTLQALDDLWTDRGPDPSVQVDYLSHDWEESDILSSWRYIRREGKTRSLETARLENAIWRTWGQYRAELKTIPPKSLDWYRDSIRLC